MKDAPGNNQSSRIELFSPWSRKKPKVIKSAIDVLDDSYRERNAAIHGDGNDDFEEENISPKRRLSKELILPIEDIDLEEPAPTLKGSSNPDQVDDDVHTTHDQLPSVEEAKMRLPSSPHSLLPQEFIKDRIFLIIGLILVVVGASAGISVIVANDNNNGESGTLITSRSEDVINLLFDVDVTPLPSLVDTTFPQHKAAMFVADGDAYQMDYNESPAAARRFIERYVLALLYYHFNGDQWNYRLKFLSAQDHCNWYDTFETATSDKIIRMGVECNGEGFVTKIDLSQNNLNGHEIPNEVQSLFHLESLHLYFNSGIGGVFPIAVKGMTNLRSLALMRTGLSGSLPDWIGDLTQLTTLALGNNNLNGAVPASISRLTRLQILGLDGNDALVGNLDLFKGMAKLEALFLENNAFSGQLPSNDRIWPNLVELDMSNNMIDEGLPVALINHHKLTVLDVHKNMLSGVFPTDIFSNTNLKVLAVQGNLLSSTIPDRLPFLQNLEHLDLSFNNLNGTIPDDLAQLTELRYWATNNNRFSRQNIPDLSRMSNLVELSMKHNNLFGTIPDWMGGLSRLQLFDLDANELSGTIPSWIGIAGNLRHIMLNRNQLTGTLPPQIANLKKLTTLLLDGNAIHGNAEVICGANDIKLMHFVADCYPGRNGEKPEIDCRCCTTCCADYDAGCNNFKWTTSLDPVWEYGFVRPNYDFSLANAPAAYSKVGEANPSDPIEDALESRQSN